MVARGDKCNRCKQVPAAEGDTWCTACTSWEAAGRELAASWDSPGCRVLASDLLLNTVRQIRALRSLGAGLARAEPDPGAPLGPPAGTRRAEEEPRGSGRERSRSDRRRSLPRRRSQPPLLREAKREPAPEEEYSDEEESGEEEEPASDPYHRPIKGERKQPPPEPDHPPPSRREERHSRAGDHRASEKKYQEHHRGDHRSSHRRAGRKRKHRAGRKHQRLKRLAVNPLAKVHRKASEALLELAIHRSDLRLLDQPLLPHGASGARTRY